MDWSLATWWWVVCGGLVAAELASGTTFYLLMLGLGAAAAALTAHAGLSFSVQMLMASVVGGAAVTWWHLRQSRHPRLPASANPNVNLDVGQSLDVKLWRADGTAEVKYRGAAWQARFIGGGLPHTGRHVIRAVEGSCLLLEAV
ncbi:Membrane protein implicated in regulation of membrane protease activity [Roseateles sp. YR242]|uniref:NfeD family protein n=1 Tax=Roseateles sp. YR242 TaxID=1855305 RepID=UPI0008D5492E|nr:NfeD family protein [Roseateles sp. YR242]SEL62270.1 Membrane protein implicated in regulation of membrane protease activity [Roseateles sp. YR242]